MIMIMLLDYDYLVCQKQQSKATNKKEFKRKEHN